MSGTLFRVLAAILLVLSLAAGIDAGWSSVGGESPRAFDSPEEILAWRPLWQAFLAYDEVMYGRDSVAVAYDKANLASFYMTEGLEQKSEQTYKESLALLTVQTAKADPSKVAAYESRLGTLLASSGRRTEAVSHLVRSLNYYSQSVSPGREFIDVSLDLAYTYMCLNNFAEAHRLLSEALNVAEVAVKVQEMEGWNHNGALWKEKVACCLSGRSTTYAMQSRLTEATEALDEARKIRQANNRYTPTRLETCFQRRNDAYMQAMNGNRQSIQLMSEAIELLRKSSLSKVCQGEFLNELGFCYCKTGDIDKAESTYKQAYDINKALFGEKDLRTADSVTGLAIAKLQRKELKVAEKLIKENLAIRAELDGKDSPTLIRAMQTYSPYTGDAANLRQFLKDRFGAIERIKWQPPTALPELPAAPPPGLFKYMEEPVSLVCAIAWFFSGWLMHAEASRIIALRKGRMAVFWAFLTLAFSVIPLMVLVFLKGHWDPRSQEGRRSPNLFADNSIASDVMTMVLGYLLVPFPALLGCSALDRDAPNAVIAVITSLALLCPLFGCLASFALTRNTRRNTLFWTLSGLVAGIPGLLILMMRLHYLEAFSTDRDCPVISRGLLVLAMLNDMLLWITVLSFCLWIMKTASL